MPVTLAFADIVRANKKAAVQRVRITYKPSSDCGGTETIEVASTPLIMGVVSILPAQFAQMVSGYFAAKRAGK